MKMRNLRACTALLGLAAMLLAVGPAAAQTDTPEGPRAEPPAGWMSLGAIAARLEGQGYLVREIETDRDGYEVKAIDPTGLSVEADLDPATGEPLRGWRRDD
jgi:hypothetical protein